MVKAFGLMIVGTHTVYVRNGDVTHIVAGNIYRSQYPFGIVELVAGPVGIVIPLRGVV